MIEIDRTQFRDALRLVGRVANPKSLLASHQATTLATHDGRLTLEAQNDFEFVSTSIACKGPDKLNLSAHASNVLARIETSEAESVRLDIDKDMLRIRSGSATWKLHQLEVGPMPTDLPSEMKEVDGKKLTAAIRRVIGSASTDFSRPHINGIIFAGGSAWGFDGASILRASVDVSIEKPFIVPLVFAKMLTGLHESTWQIGVTSRYIAIRAGSSLVASRRPATEPTDIVRARSGVSPSDRECIVPVAGFLASVRAASVSDKDLSLTVENEHLVVRTINGDTATVPCEGDLHGVTVAAERLVVALSGVTSDEVKLGTSPDPEPVQLTQADGSFEAIISPLRPQVSK